MNRDRRCQYCQQILPEYRLGVRLSGLKARIYDHVLRCGDDGIGAAELTQLTGKNLRCIYSHVSQINDALAGTDYRISHSRSARAYRLVKVEVPEC
jgi:hypothetical protein